MKGSIAFYSKLFVLRLKKTFNKLTVVVTGPIHSKSEQLKTYEFVE